MASVAAGLQLLRAGGVGGRLALGAPSARTAAALLTGQVRHSRQTSVPELVENRLHRLRKSGSERVFSQVGGYDKGRLMSPITDEQREILRGLRHNIDNLDWEGALMVLDSIPENPGEEWIPVYRAVLQCCCKAVQWDAAHSVWEKLPSRDVMSYNMLMNLYAQLHRQDDVERLFQEMCAANIQPTSVTYVTRLKGCATTGLWEQGWHIMQELKADQGLGEVNWELAYSTLMQACCRGERPDKAQEAFDEFRSMPGARISAAHFNVLINAYRGQPAEARAVFNDMRAAGFEPRVRDWRVLLGTQRGEEPEAIRGVFEEAKQALGPQIANDDLFAALLLRSRQGNVELLNWAFDEMRAAGVDPEAPGALPLLRQAAEAARERLQVWASGQLQQRAAGGLAGGHAAAAEPAQVQAQAPPMPPAGLPPGWESALDPGSGQTYYWQSADPAGTTTWERPRQ